MSKVLQERGFGSLPSSTEINPRDQVKSISIDKANFSRIRHIGCGPYVVSSTQHRRILSETVPFPNRLQNFSCDDWREAQDVKILDAYDHTLSLKEKDLWSFTLPCFIHNICFDKALVDLGSSVSVIPFPTYTNLGLGILSHSRLTIELADRTIKQPRGIAKNVLVRIGKFIFPIDYIILDIPEDDDVLLILGQPFLSTAHSKIDVFKRKITLRVKEEKLVFKSIKPATSIIKRVFVIKLEFRTWPGILLETAMISTMDLDGETCSTDKFIEHVIAIGTDNYPPMLDKSQYNSWLNHMLLYIKGKENGKQLYDSVINRPFHYGKIEIHATPTTLASTRDRTYKDLTETEKIREVCDIRATNIVLQGLPSDVYSLVNHHIVSKEI
ncbi:putative reverse transcriptase domain-containing protein [Tanacetum coccineum]